MSAPDAPRLSERYRDTLRALVRFAVVMTVIALLAGVAYRESAKKLTYEDVPAGVRLEVVQPLSLVHGHVFLLGVILPLVLAGALYLARAAGGSELDRSLRWLTRGYLPFAALSLVLLLVKGYHFLLAARGGVRDPAAIDGAFLGGSHALRFGIYAFAHVGMSVCLGVFLVALWRSLKRA